VRFTKRLMSVSVVGVLVLAATVFFQVSPAAAAGPMSGSGGSMMGSGPTSTTPMNPGATNPDGSSVPGTSAGATTPMMTGSGGQYFPETGRMMGQGFMSFWNQNGGVGVFGYPMSDPLSRVDPSTGQSFMVQYMERQRFEYHPELAGTPYETELGLLGVDMLHRQGRDWMTLPKADASAPHYFAATGHAIDPVFWDYWTSHGLEMGDPGVSYRESLALFGNPISEPMMERNSSGDVVLTQWFERARFEFHPNNPDGFRVELGRLGAERMPH
jgi:hypothetical protein